MEKKEILDSLNDMEIDVNEIMLRTDKTLKEKLPVKEMASMVAKSFESMYVVNAQINGKLQALKMTSDVNLTKFNELIKGAERRLDMQLNMVDKLTTKLLSLDLNSMSSNDMKGQEMLMNLIQDANERFNKELENLYLL